MAKDHIRDYDLTAGNNTDVDGVSIAEGTAPSNINDAIREVMSHQAELHGDIRGGLVSGGSGGAYTLTTNETLAAYAQSGGLFVFEANHAMPSTVTATLNIDTVGAKPIRKNVSVVPVADDIKANQMVIVAYEAATDVFHLLSNLGIANPITTQGDLITGGAGGASGRLALGTATQFLGSDGTDVVWEAINTADDTTVGGLETATADEQETATAVDKIVTPGRQQAHPSSPKAWAVWGIDGTLDAGYNTSITDNGDGDWTVVFGTDFSSTNYAVVTGHETNSAQSRHIEISNKLVGSVDILVVDTGGSTDEAGTVAVSVACFGDQ